jgi:hypothetical protein
MSGLSDLVIDVASDFGISWRDAESMVVSSQDPVPVHLQALEALRSGASVAAALPPRPEDVLARWYQIPAVAAGGLTVVVSPLLAN